MRVIASIMESKMPVARAWATVLLLMGLPPAARVLEAQRIKPATAERAPVVIRARGGAARAARTRDEGPPPSLPAATQLAMARAALGPGVPFTGIGAQLRLTPAAPYAPNRGVLRTSMALAVDPEENADGRITLQPDFVGSPGGPEVEVRFRPTYVGRPVLVDFVLQVSSSKGSVGAFLMGPGVKQHLTLSTSDHHVTALVVPEDTGWYTVSLSVDKVEEYLRVWVYAVELTTMN
jgi:hypothetical protein